MELHEMSCRERGKEEKPLPQEKVDELLKKVNGWAQVADGKIAKEVKFGNFVEALDFVNRVGKVAEKEQHHPDVAIHDYNRVTVQTWTHSVGGLSENDFILAAKIDKINSS